MYDSFFDIYEKIVLNRAYNNSAFLAPFCLKAEKQKSVQICAYVLSFVHDKTQSSLLDFCQIHCICYSALLGKLHYSSLGGGWLVG